jgi:hypothetical protein
MTETATLLVLLLPYLETLASTAGAGVAASDLFNVLRGWWLSEPSTELPSDKAVDWLFSTRAGARICVIILSMAISVLASGILAHATGQPVGPALDKAMAAVIASQLYHLRHMLGQQSDDAQPFTFEADTDGETE